MGWQVIAEGRSFRRDRRENDDIEEMLEDAYREGCEEGKEKGYRKAMREMRGGYGERDDVYREGRGDDNDYDRDGEYDGYGERRGVKGTGRYAGEYRRRYGRR